jgi:TolA-binding protein
MAPKLTFLVVTSAVLVGCTAELQRDVRILKRDLSQVRSIQAEHHAQLTQIQEEQSALLGRVEEMEHSQRTKIDSAVSSLRNEVDTLTRRVPPPSGVPEDLLDQDVVIAGSLAPEIGSRFQKGLDLVRVGKFNESVSVLQSALDASVGMAHTAQIYFWLGVCYQQLRDFKNALRAFNEVVTGYPSSERLPSALLRQALVFKDLGDVTTYEVTLRKLIKDFPRSAESRRAQSLLGNKNR